MRRVVHSDDSSAGVLRGGFAGMVQARGFIDTACSCVFIVNTAVGVLAGVDTAFIIVKLFWRIVSAADVIVRGGRGFAGVD